MGVAVWICGVQDVKEFAELLLPQGRFTTSEDEVIRLPSQDQLNDRGVQGFAPPVPLRIAAGTLMIAHAGAQEHRRHTNVSSFTLYRLEQLNDFQISLKRFRWLSICRHYSSTTAEHLRVSSTSTRMSFAPVPANCIGATTRSK